jgi:hypothetical protein
MTIEEVCKEMRQSIQHWKDINQNGCNDPFWSDGTNMNLVRNHIIYYKRQLEDICRSEGCDLPEEYYLATPPEVDNKYMANRKQKDRVQRLFYMKGAPVLKHYSYDEQQMSLF